MAATIARAFGEDRTRIKEKHILGSVSAEARAATWRTEAVAYVAADGSGYIEVRWLRSGITIHRYDFPPETERAEQ